MTTPTIEPTRAIPVRFGTPQAFDRLRDFLLRAGFMEPTICSRMGIATIYDFRQLHEGRERTELGDALDVLVRLFLDGEAVDGALVASHLGAEGVALLEQFGLLAESARTPGAYHATVALYPTRGLLIASDLGRKAAGSTGELAQDVVYPAVTANTQAFLDAVSFDPCERFLEMCGGTGIAALVAARGAGHAWTADITERATRFAEFNARLNGIRNFTAVQGDLYAPVAGETFDRIVAHPPYVAEPERRLIFRDGGPDGEQVTRGVIAGLHEYLAPGGRFYCTCMATDRAGAPLEQRIRGMIGSLEGEFDVVILMREVHRPSDFYIRMAIEGRTTFADAERRHVTYREFGVERLVYCSMLIERHATPRPPITLRRALGAARAGAALDWLLAVERAGLAPDFEARLLESRPAAVPGVRLRTEQQLLGDRTWAIRTCTLASDVPCASTFDCSVDAATFLSQCDGTRTVREHVARLVAEGMLSADHAEASVMALVKCFVAGGYLEVEAFPLPRPPA